MQMAASSGAWVKGLCATPMNIYAFKTTFVVGGSCGCGNKTLTLSLSDVTGRKGHWSVA